MTEFGRKPDMEKHGIPSDDEIIEFINGAIDNPFKDTRSAISYLEKTRDDIEAKLQKAYDEENFHAAEKLNGLAHAFYMCIEKLQSGDSSIDLSKSSDTVDLGETTH